MLSSASSVSGFPTAMSNAQARVTKPKTPGRPEAGLVTTWHVNKGQPSEDAVRVRNNQRRHRERVKTYIADLETKVSSLETELGAANETIANLMKEVEELRKEKATQPQESANQPSTVSPNALRPTNQAPSSLTANNGIVTRRCCRPQPAEAVDRETSDREDLPPPEEGESTTSCETAYRMLEEQSDGRLDVETAEQFLRPGYRRALRQGDGCRVQTHLVYGLLDQLTS